MSEERENFQSTTEGSPRWMGLAMVGLAVLSLIGVGLAWNATSHARAAEQAHRPPNRRHSSRMKTGSASDWHRRSRRILRCRAS